MRYAKKAEKNCVFFTKDSEGEFQLSRETKRRDNNSGVNRRSNNNKRRPQKRQQKDNGVEGTATDCEFTGGRVTKGVTEGRVTKGVTEKHLF